MMSDVTFDKYTRENLESLAVVAQCLDNQWVPRTLLADMVSRRQSLEDVEDVRESIVRGEYLRALLTAKQLVVNRAFLYNSRVVSRDYRGQGAEREAFRELLRARAIVPFMLAESSPVEPPAFTLDQGAFDSWTSVCREAGQMACVRLSWGGHNADFAANLSGRFHEFVVMAYSRGLGARIAEFGRHLDLPREDYENFRGRLKEMRTWAESVEEDKGTTVTREEFYKRFVVPEDEPPRLGRCDPGKPFAPELKQLIDLQYNTTLPEFLDRLPLRPADTLHRAALREQVPPSAGPGGATMEDFERRLKTVLAFDVHSEALTPLDTPFLLDLDLSAIARVRRSDVWLEYVEKLTYLIEKHEPGEFETYAEQLIECYAGVLRLLGEGRPTHKWLMQRRALLEVAGVSLRVIYSGKPTFQMVGDIDVAAVRSLATVRFGLINRLKEKVSPGEPDLAFDTIRTYVDDPGAFLRSIQGQLRKAGFTELPAVPSTAKLRPASIERDLAQGAA